MRFVALVAALAALAIASPVLDLEASSVEKRQSALWTKGVDVTLASGTGVPWSALLSATYRFAVHQTTDGDGDRPFPFLISFILKSEFSFILLALTNPIWPTQRAGLVSYSLAAKSIP